MRRAQQTATAAAAGTARSTRYASAPVTALHTLTAQTNTPKPDKLLPQAAYAAITEQEKPHAPAPLLPTAPFATGGMAFSSLTRTTTPDNRKDIVPTAPDTIASVSAPPGLLGTILTHVRETEKHTGSTPYTFPTEKQTEHWAGFVRDNCTGPEGQAMIGALEGLRNGTNTAVLVRQPEGADPLWSDKAYSPDILATMAIFAKACIHIAGGSPEKADVAERSSAYSVMSERSQAMDMVRPHPGERPFNNLDSKPHEYLGAHTDGVYEKQPYGMITVACVNGDHRVLTEAVPVNTILERLSPEHIAALRKEEFSRIASADYCPYPLDDRFAIISGPEDNPHIRYSTNIGDFDSPLIASPAIDALHAAVEQCLSDPEQRLSHALHGGDVLLMNNQRIVHSRNSRIYGAGAGMGRCAFNIAAEQRGTETDSASQEGTQYRATLTAERAKAQEKSIER